MRIARIAALCMAGALTAGSVHAETVEIAGLKELAQYAGQSGHTVRMEPGV